VPEYDFSTLAPSDFEQATADLLHAEHGWRLEQFGHWPDGGVDLRAHGQKGQKIVVQCKHYRGSTFADLKRAVRAELPKIEREKPHRYILVTSQLLTPKRKDELAEVLGHWLLDPSDIVTRPDLNSMLGRHSQVELLPATARIGLMVRASHSDAVSPIPVVRSLSVWQQKIMMPGGYRMGRLAGGLGQAGEMPATVPQTAFRRVSECLDQLVIRRATAGRPRPELIGAGMGIEASRATSEPKSRASLARPS
jgi:hypothetical protein